MLFQISPCLIHSPRSRLRTYAKIQKLRSNALSTFRQTSVIPPETDSLKTEKLFLWVSLTLRFFTPFSRNSWCWNQSRKYNYICTKCCNETAVPGSGGLSSAAGSGSWGAKEWSSLWRAPSSPGQTPHTPYLAKTTEAISWGSAAAPITDLPWIRQAPSAALPQQLWGGLLRLNKMAAAQPTRALCPAEPCSAGRGQPPFPQRSLALPWLQGKRLFTTLYHILRGNKRFKRQGLNTRAPSIPLVCSSTAGIHFHPHFSFPNSCGGAISWPCEATG